MCKRWAIAVVCSVSVTFGIPATAAEISLSSAIDEAMHANPSLAVAHAKWTASRERVDIVSGWPDPMVSLGVFTSPVETRVGPQRFRAGIAQRVPWFGTLGLRGEAAEHDARAVGLDAERVRRDVRVAVTERWTDLFLNAQLLDLTEQGLTILRTTESVLLERYALGTIGQADLARVQLDVTRLENDRVSLGDRAQPLRAALNAVLGRDLDSSIDVPIDWTPVRANDDENGPGSDVASNPGLRAAAARVDASHARRGLAGKSGFPDLTLGVEYIATGESDMPGARESGKDAALIVARFDLPVWRGRVRADRAEAAAMLSASESSYTDLKRRVEAELERVAFDIRDAERRLDLYEHALLPRARQAFQSAERSLASGGSSVLDMLELQRTWLEFERERARAVVDLAVYRAERDRLVGRDDPIDTGEERP